MTDDSHNTYILSNTNGPVPSSPFFPPPSHGGGGGGGGVQSHQQMNGGATPGPRSATVNCPVCNKAVDGSRINDHLDACLSGQASTATPPQQQQYPQQQYLQQQQYPQQQQYSQQPGHQRPQNLQPQPPTYALHSSLPPMHHPQQQQMLNTSQFFGGPSPSSPGGGPSPVRYNLTTPPSYYVPPYYTSPQQQHQPQQQYPQQYGSPFGPPASLTPSWPTGLPSPFPSPQPQQHPQQTSRNPQQQQQTQIPMGYPGQHHYPQAPPVYMVQQHQQQQGQLPPMVPQQYQPQLMSPPHSTQDGQPRRPIQQHPAQQFPPSHQQQQLFYPGQLSYRNMSVGRPGASNLKDSQEYQHFMDRYQQMQRLSGQHPYPVKGGWVHMCCVPSKIFVKQYTCVQQFTVYVYDQQPLGAAGPRPRARYEIPLRNVSSFKHGPATTKYTRKQFSFIIYMNDKNQTTYYFATKSKPELDAWVALLQQRINDLQRPPAPALAPAPVSQSTAVKQNPADPSASYVLSQTPSHIFQPSVHNVTPKKQTSSPTAKAKENNEDGSFGFVELPVDRVNSSSSSNQDPAVSKSPSKPQAAEPTKTPSTEDSVDDKNGNVAYTPFMGKISSALHGWYNSFSGDQWTKADEDWMRQFELNHDVEANKKAIASYMQKIFVTRTHPIGRRVLDCMAEISKNCQILYDKPPEAVLPVLTSQLLHFNENIVASAKSRFPILSTSSEYEEACMQALQEALFNEIYTIIFGLYKLRYKEDDVKHAERMKELESVTPADMVENPQLWLMGEKDDELPNNKQQQLPYEAAIYILKALPTMQTPAAKLRVLVDTNKVIMDCVQVYWFGKGAKKEVVVACDDLLPILAYVIIKSKVRYVYSETMFIQDFVTDGQKMGMEGYSLATFQAACASLFCFTPGQQEQHHQQEQDHQDQQDHQEQHDQDQQQEPKQAQLLPGVALDNNEILMPQQSQQQHLTPSSTIDLTSNFAAVAQQQHQAEQQSEEADQKQQQPTATQPNFPYLISFDDD
eukprot:TRINITY_DN2991_c0_g1_i1.p1 TRINITY_DN2991_c0_g1~~TRINITY_DN2991_c0_g1_i1.p1  ORF type:complete len:1016 (+),score=257.45 TRINITY_DN2991_c0_g1_i1:1035-4082(+)